MPQFSVCQVLKAPSPLHPRSLTSPVMSRVFILEDIPLPNGFCTASFYAAEARGSALSAGAQGRLLAGKEPRGWRELQNSRIWGALAGVQVGRYRLQKQQPRWGRWRQEKAELCWGEDPP